ncbi:hypothetical protein ACW9HQ_41780, partial [Nocardia gipuzkoensis]
QEEILLLSTLTVAWERAELSGQTPRLAALYAVEPELAAPLYVLALLQSGDRELARVVFDDHRALAPGFYRVIMAALRAHAAIALDSLDDARELLEILRPHSGTMIGLDTGATVLGSMDVLLARLADACGDSAAAREFRCRATVTAERLARDLRALPRP